MQSLRADAVAMGWLSFSQSPILDVVSHESLMSAFSDKGGKNYERNERDVMRVKERLHDPAEDRWPMPEGLRRPLRTVFRLTGLVVVAAIISLAVVALLPMPLKYKPILFSILGCAIYALLVVRTGTTKSE
jgi:hypothetical protein